MSSVLMPIVRSAHDEEAEDLRREATVLRRAQHPGVVALMETDDDGGAVRIVLGCPDGPRLGEAVLTLEEIAAVFAVLATTLADLHDLGIALGSLEGDGVILGPDGRPVFVDLSHATFLDSTDRRRLSSERARADVRELGALLSATLRRCAPEQLTLPLEGGRPWWRRRPPGLAHALAESAATADRGDLPARQVATGLIQPGARLPRPVADPRVTPPTVHPADGATPLGSPRVAPRRPAASALGSSTPSRHQPLSTAGSPASPQLDSSSSRRWSLGRWSLGRWSLGRWRRPIIGLSAVAGAALLALGVAGPSRPRITTLHPSTDVPISLCLASSPSGSCISPATYSDGVLHTPTSRFAVGRLGDVVTVGRWSCGATSALALLRPDRGEVWAFSSWPNDSAHPLTGRLVTHVAGARRLVARPGPGCDALVVVRDDGTSIVLDRRVFP